MSTVYIGIGSNLGDREGNCLRAVKLLSEDGLIVRKQSSLYETEPWGLKDQPEFINMAIEAETGLEPLKLLELLKNIEKQMGRDESVRWGPRVIDLDILFYNDMVIDTPEFRIPHPLMHERDFVLKPLAEIAPEKEHPVVKKTVREMLSGLNR